MNNMTEVLELCYTTPQSDRLQKVDEYFKFPVKCLYACLSLELQSDLPLLGIDVSKFEAIYNAMLRSGFLPGRAFIEAFIQVAEDNMAAEIAEKKAEEMEAEAVNNCTEMEEITYSLNCMRADIDNILSVINKP